MRRHYPDGPSAVPAASELVDQPGQRHQILNQKPRTPRAQNQFRVGRYQIGPLRWHRVHDLPVGLQEQAFAIAVIALADARQCLAAGGMKRMGDADKPLGWEGNRCTLS